MMQLSKEREITIIVFLMGDYSFAYNIMKTTNTNAN